jgi:hypothetical protein
MNKNKTKHTGEFVFPCRICEFEATRKLNLENHMEAKHTKQNLWWNENQKSDHFCKKCENKFKNLFVKRYHLCNKESKLDEYFTHKENTHTRKTLNCNDCNYTSTCEK